VILTFENYIHLYFARYCRCLTPTSPNEEFQNPPMHADNDHLVDSTHKIASKHDMHKLVELLPHISPQFQMFLGINRLILKRKSSKTLSSLKVLQKATTAKPRTIPVICFW
jgi:hypothetical protein